MHLIITDQSTVANLFLLCRGAEHARAFCWISKEQSDSPDLVAPSTDQDHR